MKQSVLQKTSHLAITRLFSHSLGRLQQFTGNLNERLVLTRADDEGGTIRGVIYQATAGHK
jgi:hypothetical protein